MGLQVAKVLRNQKKIAERITLQTPDNPLILDSASEDEDPALAKDFFNIATPGGGVGDPLNGVEDDQASDGFGDEDVESSNVEGFEEEYVYEESN